MLRLVCLAIGYLIGCIQSAYFVGKMSRVDLRKYGSGNLGTTNALRVLGKKAGAVTFLCDVAKSLLSFLLCWWMFDSVTAGLYGSLGAVLGHDFPFYLGFHGGKGVAASIGLMIALTAFRSPYFMVCALGLALVGLLVANAISLGSLCLVGMLPAVSMVLYGPTEETVALLLLFLLTLYQHRENLKRLSHGTENPFFGKKKTASASAEGGKKEAHEA
ncbi:MAG TPA: glycerol-3-phosphate 1-O-acyltransferase PlsY [Firmicutes bacterium]|nr:glycerol-3-phosphate 1-O-acyltransferase PlsY [Bacillota bacterium]